MANEINIKGAFGAVKSESSYISSRSDVISARNKFAKANDDFLSAKRTFDSVTKSDKNYKKYADALALAKRKLDTAKAARAGVESRARQDYKQAKAKLESEKQKEKNEKGGLVSAPLNQQILAAENELQRLKDSGQDTTAQQKKVDDLKAKKDGVKPTGTTTGTTESTTGSAIRDYTKEVTEAAKKIDGMSEKARRDLQQSLKDAGYYRGPINGLYSETLVEAYRKIIIENQVRSKDLGREISFNQFLTDKIMESQLGATTGGAAGPKVSGAVSYSTKLEAASRIETLFRQELGRAPTAQEILDFTDKLQKREKKKSAITKYTTTNKNGMVVTETSGGLDRDQFIINLIRQLPEYNEKKFQARQLTKQTLAQVAAANGLNLEKNFGSQVDVWLQQIENGTDINTIKAIIRKTAATGMPERVAKLLEQGVDLDTVYAPYQFVMENILELPRGSVTLDDPTLRSAITSQGEIPLYDFERMLRKDSRWQYTNNARETVSSSVLQVLRDFGFQG